MSISVSRGVAMSSPRRMALRRRLRSWTPDLLMLPALLATAVTMGFPLVYLIYLSLHKWSLIGFAAPAFVACATCPIPGPSPGTGSERRERPRRERTTRWS